MEERKTETISRQAWRIYAIDPARVAALSAIVFAILLASLALGLWIDGAFVVFFLMLGVPAIFAAFLWLFGFKKGGQLSLGSFPRLYFAYFASPFRGIFRAIASFFKSLLVFFISSIFVLFLYYVLSPNFDPSFQEAMRQLAEAYELQDYNLFASLLSENASLTQFYRILYPIVYGISAAFLIHFLMVGSIEVSGRADVPPVVAEGTTVKVFSNSCRRIRRQKAWEYWKACWFLPLVFLLAFALGVVLGSRIEASNLFIPTIIGFASGAFAYLLLLPYHAEVSRLLMGQWEKEIFALAAKTMRQLLVQASASHALDEKGSAFFLKRLERLEKALEDETYRQVKPLEEPEFEDYDE